MDNYNRTYNAYEQSVATEQSEATVFSALMRKVYVWMTLALVLSGLTAYYVSGNYTLLEAIFTNKVLFWGLIIAEFGLVIGLSAAINKLSFPVAACMFAAYSIINGLLLSGIFIAYTMSSIATTFFVTAGTFAAMAVVGTITKMDLTKFGGVLIMALIGLIIATLVNLFLHNSTLELVTSGIGVLIFTGLTAYDAQKIKEMMLQAEEVNDTTQKIAVLGALSLYLDFINLFLYLLRFLGNRK
jgi:FtsH-binding integral membrane protein